MDTYLIEFDHQTFDAADVVIFKGTADERAITVSTNELPTLLQGNIYMWTELGNDAEMLDNDIACYVEPEMFDMSEEEFINYIETEYYDK